MYRPGQFLKTDATEFKHILRTVQTVALAHTAIDIEVEADGETIYKLPPADLEQRVTDLFGRQYKSRLIPFSEQTSYVTIRGLLSDPGVAKKSRGEQFLFVNRRPVQHRYLTHLILSIFEQVIGRREYPFYALFLDIDPKNVDVNVHPAKLEVKFDDEKSVVQLTRSVIKKALHHYLMVPDLSERSESILRENSPSFDQLHEFLDPGSDRGGNRKGEPGLSGVPREDKLNVPSRINFSTTGDDLGAADSGDPSSSVQSRGKEIGGNRVSGQDFWQLHQRYILSQTRSGLCLVDQYRAHMRVIFEKTLSATEEALPGTQQLLFAQTVHFDASDFRLLKELLPILRRMGFSIQLLSGKSAILNGVPADIDIGNEQTVLHEMLGEYRDLEKKPELDARKRIAAAFASKTAIPRGKRLLPREMELIIDQLFACEEPYRDPFGKPILINLTVEEIANRFRS